MKSMKNNKTPGNDVLTKQIFWNFLGITKKSSPGKY